MCTQAVLQTSLATIKHIHLHRLCRRDIRSRMTVVTSGREVSHIPQRVFQRVDTTSYVQYTATRKKRGAGCGMQGNADV